MQTSDFPIPLVRSRAADDTRGELTPGTMPRRLLRTLTFLFLMLPLLSCSQGVDHSAEISEVFRNFMIAIAAGDGDAAAEYVTQSTLEEYATFGRLALSASEAELLREQPGVQFQVLLLRQRSNPEQVEHLDGRALFAWYIDQGLAAGGDPARNQLGSFAISDDSASAQLYQDGRTTRRRIHFVRESEAWKLDQRLGRRLDERIESGAQEAGTPWKEYLVSLVEESTETPPREDLWLPLRPAENGG